MRIYTYLIGEEEEIVLVCKLDDVFNVLSRQYLACDRNISSQQLLITQRINTTDYDNTTKGPKKHG